MTLEPMTTSQGCKSLIPDSTQLEAEFLSWWLLSNRNYLQSLGSGATFKELSKSKLGAVTIPLPPKEQQRRITEVLDRANALRIKRRAGLSQLDELTRSVFLELFGDPVTNSQGWPTRELGHIADVITGNTPPRSEPAYYGEVIEWIKSDNINSGATYATRAEEGLSSAGKSISRIVPRGAILVTCIAGSPSAIGNIAMTDREVAFNQQINALVPKGVETIFLFAQLKIGKKLIQQASTGGMKGLVSKSRLGRVSILFPPRDLQKAFARRSSSFSGK